jgi:hypothetical protein
VLSRTFGPEDEEVKRSHRELYIEEIKWRRWAGHVARLEKQK